MPAALRFALPRIPLAALLVAVLLGLPAATLAQETGDPPPSDPALPDLAPREIEIRGELEIAFPSLRRQPLVGFNPPPQVPELPASRRPFAGTYKQRSADLPPSPLQRPQPPSAGLLDGASPNDGLAEATAGRYADRSLRIAAGTPLTMTETLYGTVDYHGSDGPTPFDDSDVRSSYDRAEGRVGVKTERSRVAVGGELHGYTDRYTLYGTELAAGAPSSFVNTPERTGERLAGRAWVSTRGAVPTDLRVGLTYGVTSFQTDVFSDRSDPRYERTEHRIALDAEVDVPIGSLHLLGELDAASVGFDDASAFSDDLRQVGARTALQFPFRGRFDLTLGAHVMGYQAAGGQISSTSEKAYVGPVVAMAWYPTGGSEVFLRNDPHLQANSLYDLHQANPYLADEPAVRPTIYRFDAAFGGRVFFGRVQVFGEVGYKETPTYRYFAATDQALGFRRGIFRVAYDRARILRAQVGTSVLLPQGFQTTWTFSLRQGTLTDLDADIPFFAPYTGEAMLSYALMDRRLRLQATAVLEGPRSLTTDEIDDLPPLFSADLEVAYMLTTNLGLLVRGEQLGVNQELWERYPWPSAVVSGGIRFMW